jgi:hypothetical protein
VKFDVGMAGASLSPSGALVFGGGAPLGDAAATPNAHLWRVDVL